MICHAVLSRSCYRLQNEISCTGPKFWYRYSVLRFIDTLYLYNIALTQEPSIVVQYFLHFFFKFIYKKWRLLLITVIWNIGYVRVKLKHDFWKSRIPWGVKKCHLFRSLGAVLNSNFINSSYNSNPTSTAYTRFMARLWQDSALVTK